MQNLSQVDDTRFSTSKRPPQICILSSHSSNNVWHHQNTFTGTKVMFFVCSFYVFQTLHGGLMWSEQHKMRSQLAAQFMPLFRVIARILTFRDKKYRILTFCDKKYRILTFCDKTELYLTVLQQNNVEACLRCEASLSFVPSLPNAQLQLMPACDIGSIQMEKCVVDQIQWFYF